MIFQIAIKYKLTEYALNLFFNILNNEFKKSEIPVIIDIPDYRKISYTLISTKIEPVTRKLADGISLEPMRNFKFGNY